MTAWHPLDNPVRSSLAGPHARFAERRGDVLRYSKGSKPLGIEPGEYARVSHVDRESNTLTVKRHGGEELSYDPRRLQGVTVYRDSERVFAQGDREVRLATEPGDYIFVPPYAPHREENPGAEEAVVIIARSSQEGIVVNLESLWPGGEPGTGR